jgi:hypothetical protein
MEQQQDDASSAADRESVTPTIAKNAPFKRKTETDARKLSILEVRKQIYSMSGKSMDSKSAKRRHEPVRCA